MKSGLSMAANVAMGQSQSFVMSVLLPLYPLKADIHRKAWHVTKVPHRSK